MIEICVRIAVGILRCVNLFFKPLRLKEKVVIISRQSDTATLDIQLLCEELDKQDVAYVVLARTLKKSLIGAVSYGLHMLSQMYHLATSKVVVLDGYCILVSVLPKRENQSVIQMWHALGAIKKFGWQNTENPDGHGSRFSEIMQMHKHYDYVLAPGKITGSHFAEAFRTTEDKVVHYGLPRIDYIRHQDQEKKAEMLSAYPDLEEKEIVLYVPTFRKNAAIEMEPFIAGFPFEQYHLIIKKHFLDKGDYTWAEKAGAIVDQRFPSMDWLRICDKVITDYSAMAFEAAVGGKALYIFQPDAADYANNVGLNIDLQQEAIGQYVCKSEDALFSVLKVPYDFEKMIAFREKYIDIDLEHCTADLCSFIQKLCAK